LTLARPAIAASLAGCCARSSLGLRFEDADRLPLPGCPGLGDSHGDSLPLGALYATGVTRTLRVASLPPRLACFHAALRSLLQPPSPASFETGSFSRELYVPFRVRASNDLPLATSRQPCGHLEAKERLPWGSVPLRDISWRRPLTTRVPNSDLTLRPWRFSRLRRFTPPPALRVYFTPQPRPGFALQGFVPHHGAFAGFHRQCPSCPLEPSRLRLPAPATKPPSCRALLPMTSAVVLGRRLIRRDSAPLLSFILLRVFVLLTVGAPSRPLRPRPSPRRTLQGWSPAYRQ